MEFLLGVLLILVLARGLGEIAERLNLPSIAGEVTAGIAVGLGLLFLPVPLSFIPTTRESDAFRILLDISVFFLMLTAGMEVKLESLLKNSRLGIPVAIGGVVLPLGAGFLLGLAFVPMSNLWVTQALFLGVAMAITAVPISVGTLMDLGALETRVGMVIVDAAVVDDVIGIILLAMLIGMIGTGAVPAWTDIGLLMVQVGVFFTVSALLGLWVLPRVGVFLSWMRAPHIHLTIAIVFGAAMAILSERLGMHFMIGAFVAGVLIRDRMVRSEHVNEEVEHQLNGISAAVLAPLFFASIGLAINLTAFQTALWFTIWLIAVAFFTKLVGCAIPAILMGITKKESLAVGVGMTSRGGVELVVALVALQSGLFNAPVPVPPVVSAMFSAVVSMAIISSVIAPICLRMLLGNVAARDNSNVLP